MKCISLLMALVITILLSACTAKPATVPGDNIAALRQDYAGSITAAGLQRSYLVHLPVSYDKSLRRPLVVVLHGGGSDAESMVAMTGFNAVADKGGFVVAYPAAYKHTSTGSGLSQHWNDGRGEAQIRAQSEDIDDVAFISALIEKLAQELNIDTKSVYVTGISNGALMSHRLACELSGRIAAIAPVEGNIPQKTISTWSPSHPVSVLLINGTEDPVMPFNGGEITMLSFKTGMVVPVAETVDFWVSRNGCQATPVREQLADLNPDDNTTTVIERYAGGRDGNEVALYRVDGGGHTWPGGPQYMPEKLIGRVSRDFNASEIIWQFFKAHSRKQ